MMVVGCESMLMVSEARVNRLEASEGRGRKMEPSLVFVRPSVDVLPKEKLDLQ